MISKKLLISYIVCVVIMLINIIVLPTINYRIFNIVYLGTRVVSGLIGVIILYGMIRYMIEESLIKKAINK